MPKSGNNQPRDKLGRFAGGSGGKLLAARARIREALARREEWGESERNDRVVAFHQKAAARAKEKLLAEGRARPSPVQGDRSERLAKARERLSEAKARMKSSDARLDGFIREEKEIIARLTPEFGRSGAIKGAAIVRADVEKESMRLERSSRAIKTHRRTVKRLEKAS